VRVSLLLALAACTSSGSMKASDDTGRGSTSWTTQSTAWSDTDTTPTGTASTTDSAADLCRGTDPGEATLGALTADGFVPWTPGSDAPMDEDAGGVLGLPLAVQLTGLDQTGQLSALVDVYLGDALLQSAFGGVLTDCEQGVGVATRFVPFEDDADADALSGLAARVAITLSDPQAGTAHTEAEVVLR
jgi:hypothetical protein